jgi:hypothetical protein
MRMLVLIFISIAIKYLARSASGKTVVSLWRSCLLLQHGAAHWAVPGDQDACSTRQAAAAMQTLLRFILPVLDVAAWQQASRHCGQLRAALFLCENDSIIRVWALCQKCRF